MDARLERKLRRLAGVVVAGAIAGIVFSLAQGHGSARSVVAGIAYGVLISAALGSIQYFVLEGPMRAWLSGHSFAANLIVRSMVYAAVIAIIQGLELGERIAGLPLGMSSQIFWSSFVYSAVLRVAGSDYTRTWRPAFGNMMLPSAEK